MACQSVIPSSLCVANLFTDEMKRETGKRGCIECKVNSGVNSKAIEDCKPWLEGVFIA